MFEKIIIGKYKKIAFLVPYPLEEAPSQRFRFEQYFGVLSENNIRFTVYSFYSVSLWKSMYSSGSTLKKGFSILLSLIRRWLHLFKCLDADFVFIHREVTPLGPPVFEFLLAKVFRKKIIYDFDDAIWLTDEKKRLSNVLRCFWKVKYICKWSYKVSCGNEYLAEYARKWNKNVVVNPTTIDTDYHVLGSKTASLQDLSPLRSKRQDRFPQKRETATLGDSRLKIQDAVPQTQDSRLKTQDPRPNTQDPIAIDGLIKIGWTGSHSTLKYLDALLPVLKKFEDEIQTIVVCNKNPKYDLKHFCFIPWSKETEVSALYEIDFGVMPLPDDRWAMGKCGFKALQYFGVGKPVVASPVGVNKEIVENGVNGFLASSNQEWSTAIEKMIALKNEWYKMGLVGRELVQEKYSVESNQELFLSLFE